MLDHFTSYQMGKRVKNTEETRIIGGASAGKLGDTVGNKKEKGEARPRPGSVLQGHPDPR